MDFDSTRWMIYRWARLELESFSQTKVLLNEYETINMEEVFPNKNQYNDFSRHDSPSLDFPDFPSQYFQDKSH